MKERWVHCGFFSAQQKLTRTVPILVVVANRAKRQRSLIIRPGYPFGRAGTRDTHYNEKRVGALFTTPLRRHFHVNSRLCFFFVAKRKTAHRRLRRNYSRKIGGRQRTARDVTSCYRCKKASRIRADRERVDRENFKNLFRRLRSGTVEMPHSAVTVERERRTVLFRIKSKRVRHKTNTGGRIIARFTVCASHYRHVRAPNVDRHVLWIGLCCLFMIPSSNDWRPTLSRYGRRK